MSEVADVALLTASGKTDSTCCSASSILAEGMMLTIRLTKAQWPKAWRARIEIAPVRLIRDDPVFEVLPAHLEMLTARGFAYEILPVRSRRVEKRRHGPSRAYQFVQ